MQEEQKNNSPKEMFGAMEKAKSPICCVSARPDYDGFCSALVMNEFMANEFGVDLRVVYYNSIADSFKFVIDKFTDLSQIEESVDIDSIDFSKYDLMLYTDTSEKGFISDPKIENFEIPENLVSINIDHHSGQNDYFADYNYVEKASSTCVVLYDLFKEQGYEITPTMASLLVLGILDDSLIFQVEEVRTKDLIAVAELIDLIPLRNLFDFVYELTYNQSRTEFMYSKLTLKNATLDEDNECVYSYITRQEMEEAGIALASKPSISPVELLRKVAVTDYAFLLKQSDDDPRAYSLSLRSHDPDFDVSAIAREFGGGGHKMAAGGMIYDVDSPQEAIERVISKVNELNIR